MSGLPSTFLTVKGRPVLWMRRWEDMGENGRPEYGLDYVDLTTGKEHWIHTNDVRLRYAGDHETWMGG